MRLGDRLASTVSHAVGSWWFVGIQTLGLIAWVVLNTLAATKAIRWDGYPYVFLNLMLSFQAAYTGPILLIAARRQEAIQAAQQKYMLHLMEAVKTLLEEHRNAEHRTGIDRPD